MEKFKCKFCNREMTDSLFVYKLNPYCNSCFEDRAEMLELEEVPLTFFGMVIDSEISDKNDNNER